MINKIVDRVISPPNNDNISKKKTKYNLFICILLFIIFQIIVFIVTITDKNNRLTFVESKIENDLKIPSFFLCANISSFSYNILNISDHDDDGYQVNSKNSGCEFNYLNGDSSCTIPNENINKTEYNNVFYPFYKPSNITFQKTYIRVGMVISNILKIPNPTTVNEIMGEKISSISFKDGTTFTISPPAKVEILFKKEVYIDIYGNEKIHFSPVLVTSPFFLNICNNLTNNDIVWNCFIVDISIKYQTNVVLYYSEETNRQLVTRILANISSISKLVVSLIFVSLTFIVTNFLFDQKTAWFPNNTRDAVLHHYDEYKLGIQPIINPSLLSRLISKIKSRLLRCFKRKFKNQIKMNVITNEYEKLTTNDDPTQGSESKFKRIFQDIDPQDEISLKLSNLSFYKSILYKFIMIILSAIIIFKNHSNRIAITQFETQQLLEVPKMNFSFIGNDVYWLKSLEILPNGEINECVYDELEFVECKSSKNFTNYNHSSIVKDHSVVIDQDSIYLNKSEIYQFNVNFDSIFIGEQVFDSNNMIIKLSINDIVYLIKPFSNITVLLEKTIFHKSDGITNITMYDTNLIVSQKDNYLYENKSTLTYIVVGSVYLNIQYQNHEIRHIYEETDIQIGQRIIQYIMSFTSPLSIIIGFIFTYLIIRLLFKDPSAHCDSDVRESTIYFLRNYKKYPEIFK